MTTSDYERLQGTDRALARGLRGRRVAWLNSDGSIDRTTLLEEIIELPRCPNEVAFGLGMGASPNEVAAAMAERTGMEVAKVVAWEPLEATEGHDWLPFPAAIGVLLVATEIGVQ